MKTKEANRPAYVKQVGAMRAAVWANGNDERTYFNVTVTRTYRDGETFKLRRFQARTGKKGGYFVDLLPVLPAAFKSGNARDEETSGNGPKDF